MFVYGASGHGKVVCEIAQSLGLHVEVFVDENHDLQVVCNIPVVAEIPNNLNMGLLGIGNNQIRKNLAIKYSTKEYAILLHPKANIAPSAYLRSGTVVMAGATINSSVQIGAHVIVNTNASVDHDCILEDFVHVSPNVALSGGVSVGEGTHIGIGACVIPGIKIGRWAIIGAGAVIIKDVPDGVIVVGNPGRIIKYIKL
jgi:sugar O-acyltransferase (sialic acid O-acetyltransferase NeuD family)